MQVSAQPARKVIRVATGQSNRNVIDDVIVRIKIANVIECQVFDIAAMPEIQRTVGMRRPVDRAVQDLLAEFLVVVTDKSRTHSVGQLRLEPRKILLAPAWIQQLAPHVAIPGIKIVFVHLS